MGMKVFWQPKEMIILCILGKAEAPWPKAGLCHVLASC